MTDKGSSQKEGQTCGGSETQMSSEGQKDPNQAEKATVKLILESSVTQTPEK